MLKEHFFELCCTNLYDELHARLKNIHNISHYLMKNRPTECTSCETDGET